MRKEGGDGVCDEQVSALRLPATCARVGNLEGSVRVTRLDGICSRLLSSAESSAGIAAFHHVSARLSTVPVDKRKHIWTVGDVKKRRQIINKQRSLRIGKDKHGTSRFREAQRLAACARTMWTGMHASLIALGVAYGKELQTAWTKGWYWYLAGLFGLLAGNAILYVTVSVMDPGYQPPGSTNGQVREDTQRVDMTASRDADWLTGQIFDTGMQDKQSAVACAVDGGVTVAGISGGASAAYPVGACGPRARVGATSGRSFDNGTAVVQAPPPLSVALEIEEAAAVPPGRLCSYCCAWQPLRAKHCHDCDRCVRLFDHHCVWLGNCVGVRNYRLFFLYLVTQGICIAWGLRIYLSGYRGISSIRRTAPAMSRARSALDLWVEEHLPLLAGTGALVVFGVFIVSLLGYHTYLVATNQTTYELVKQGKGSPHYLRDVPYGVAPFSRGPLQNCRAFACQRRGWGEDHSMPSATELLSRASVETFWNNRHYSCFD